jgi:hypothetical protein
MAAQTLPAVPEYWYRRGHGREVSERFEPVCALKMGPRCTHERAASVCCLGAASTLIKCRSRGPFSTRPRATGTCFVPRRPAADSTLGPLNVGDRTFVGGHLIDPKAEKWTTIPTPWWSQQNSRTVLASSEAILVWGGASDVANLADGYLLRP